MVFSDHPPRLNPKSNISLWTHTLLVMLVLAGCAYRLYMALNFPVSYDEVFVIALGVDEMMHQGVRPWIEVPLTRSGAITPLWWWATVWPSWMWGELTLAALRVVPVCLGLLTPLVAYLSVVRFGRTAALLFAAFVATSDIVAFSNVRAEYSESLLMVFGVAAVCHVGDNRRAWIRGFMWLGLLLTHFGKGIFMVGLAALAEVVVSALRTKRRTDELRAFVISTTVALIPTLAWFVLADLYIRDRAGLGHVSFEADSAWELAYDITFGYSETRSHMVGSVGDALLVYADAYVWPVTSLLAVPLAAILFVGLANAWRRRRRLSERQLNIIGLTVWGLLGFCVVVFRGIIGARFHLMYLPAMWLAAAFILTDRRMSVPRWLPWAVIPLWGLHLGVACSWVEWDARRILWPNVVLIGSIVTISAGLLWWLIRRTSRPSVGTRRAVERQRWWALCAFGMAMVVVGSAWGPIRWGPTARFEPMHGSDELSALDAWRSGRGPRPEREQGTLYIYLTNYFTQIGNLDKAEHFGQLAVKDTPDAAAAWTYLALVYEAQDRAKDLRQETWEHALMLKPDSAFIREHVEKYSPAEAD